MIVVQTPLRVSFFGGGTDFPSYYLKEGGCVLTSAIDKYVFVNVKWRFDELLRVGYTKTEMVGQVKDIQHELIREAFKMTKICQGVEITTMGDIPTAGTGLGSSSTVTVGALHALYTLLGEIVPSERLAREACEIEIDILRKPIGVQDQYIAAYGGLRFVEFNTDGSISVERVHLCPEHMRRLNENLLLFYTGKPRSAAAILTEQLANIEKRMKTLQRMGEMARIARIQLEAGDVDSMGDLLHEAWMLKKLLANGISSAEIDNLYEKARTAGALGGKITGAGGGGFFLLYCPHEKQEAVRNALDGLRELPFLLEHDGSKVIFNYNRQRAAINGRI